MLKDRSDITKNYNAILFFVIFLRTANGWSDSER